MAEIRDGIMIMEASFQRVLFYSSCVVEQYSRILSAFNLLEDLGSRLPSYIMQSHLYLIKWDDEGSKIAERMCELIGLRDTYAGFLLAYDSLIIEVGRRKHIQQKMMEIRAEALVKIKELYMEDVEERNIFKQQHGDFLPRDIWPGLTAEPPRFDIVEESGIVPDITASVIQRAIRRVNGVTRNNPSTSQQP